MHLNAEPVLSTAEISNMISSEVKSGLVNQIDHAIGNQKAKILVVASGGDDVDTNKNNPVEKNTADSESRSSWIQKVLFVTLFIVAVGCSAAGIILFADKGGADDHGLCKTNMPTPDAAVSAPPKTHVPSMAPILFKQAKDFFNVLDLLKPSLMGPPTAFEESSFFDATSVQYTVLDWMANVDQETKILMGVLTMPAKDRLELILQRYSVYSLYLRWGNDAWTQIPTDLERTSVCSWNYRGSSIGTFCDGDGRVTGVVFVENNMSGPLMPSELLHLKHLELFLVPRNHLTGTISPMIGRYLPNLFEFDAYGMQITGAVPTEIGMLKGLKKLMLFQNELTGVIPVDIGQLSVLGMVLVHDNMLSGTIPSEIGQVRNLRRINLANNNELVGTVPPQIGRLSNLAEFSISGTSITGNLDPIFCTNDEHDWAILASNCLESTLGGEPLPQTVCSCCTSCS